MDDEAPSVVYRVHNECAEEPHSKDLCALAERAPLGFAILDADLRFIALNEAFAAIDGCPRSAHYGRALAELWPEAYRRLETKLRPLLETGVPLLGQEIPAPRAEREVCFVRMHGFLINLSGGRPGLAALAEVATPSPLSAEPLSRLGALGALLGGARDRIAIAANALEAIESALSADASLLFAHEEEHHDPHLSLLAARGLDPARLSALRGLDEDTHGPIIHAACLGRAEWGETLTSNERANLPVANITEMNTLVALPLLAEGRSLGALVFGFRTPRVLRLEERVYALAIAAACALAFERHSFREAEQRVKKELFVLTGDCEKLHEAERKAQREAEFASRAKDDFLTVLSHELRTPLTAVLGWANILRTRKTDEATRRRALEIIERNAKIQAQLIEDILDVSRIIAGTLQISHGTVDLHATVHAAIDKIKPQAKAKELTIDVDLGPPLGSISGDGERLKQVIWNLLSNAVKFTPPGGLINVRLRHVGANVRLEVRDNGQGITPEFIPHVFKRFVQADASAKRAHGGLGLGLSIVEHVIARHGGTITAESEGQGRGATFTVLLPSTQPEPVTPTAGDQSERSSHDR